LRILDTLADGDFYLLSIAVDDDMRGEGVGSALIDSIEVRARASGARRLSLDVSAKNEGARRLYERRGMTVESQWPKRLVIPGLKLLRMTKTL
jgi:ribosomal protein S18 acetylase RimI-like enzyme